MNKRQLVADLDTTLTAYSYLSHLCTAYDAEGLNEAILTEEQTTILRASRDVLTALHKALQERLMAQQIIRPPAEDSFDWAGWPKPTKSPHCES